jgi:hypothetical protein
MKITMAMAEGGEENDGYGDHDENRNKTKRRTAVDSMRAPRTEKPSNLL